MDTLSQATVSHPTTELRECPTQQSHSSVSLSYLSCSVPPSSPVKGDTHTQASVPPYNRAKGDTLTQAALSHQAKVYTLTQIAAVQLRGTLLPKLQCPTQQSSQGGLSNPGYSVQHHLTPMNFGQLTDIII